MGIRGPWLFVPLKLVPGWAAALGFAAWTLGCCGHSEGAPPPAIQAFQADRAEVELGSEVVLATAFSHGVGKLEPGCLLVNESGQIKVKPVATTTYELTVTNGQGQKARRCTTVVVRPGLAVTIEGHQGIAGEVTVEGPQGFRRSLSVSTILTGLQPGEYTIQGAPIRKGDHVHHPWEPIQRRNVVTGSAVRVSYPQPTFTVNLPGGVPMTFLLLPAGTFTMGTNNPGEPKRTPSPSPAHQVTLPRAFYLAQYLTTQEQWSAVTGKPVPAGTGPKEAADVSFREIKEQFLPNLRNFAPDHGFRLPSEAEWEYACRAGTTTDYFHGPDAARILDYAWDLHSYLAGPHPVGVKRPNPWGLYDMTGLSYQWCEDLAHNDYRGAPTDGSPWLDPGPTAMAEQRVVRGVDPVDGPTETVRGSSYDRLARGDRFKEDGLGFRLAATGPDGWQSPFSGR